MWVGSGYSEQVQSYEGLEDKLIPKTQGKRGINTSEFCKEIIFPSANGVLSSIEVMSSSGCELKMNDVDFHEELEHVGGFIIPILDIWIKSMVREVGMDEFIGSCHFWAASTLHGFDKDGVAIIIINN